MALREMWRVKGRLLLLALILALQVMTIGGAYVMTNSFTASRDEHYRTLRFADLTIGFVPAAAAELPTLVSLRAIDGVAGVSRRYVTRGTIEDAGGPLAGGGAERPPWPVVIEYLDPGPQEVNDIAILEGHRLSEADKSGAIIDSSFASERHVKLGDPIIVNPHRFATRFTIAGVGMSPEYLTPAVDPRFLMPAKGSMGVIYASRAKLDEVFVDPLYNELLFRYVDGADEKVVRARILTALAGLEVDSVVPRRANLGYRLHEELLRSPKTLTPILAFVVGVLGAIVAYVLTMRIVEGQRREIGTLLAVGFPSWQFVLAYLLVGLVPAVAGAAVGVRLAIDFGRANLTTQAAAIGIEAPSVVVPWPALLGAASFAVAITIVGVLVPLASVLRMTPALAMRGGNEIVFGGLPRPLEWLLARSTPDTRYALRNVARRLRLSFSVIALLAAGIAAPAALLTVNSSWELWAAQTASRIHWDATLNFRVPLEANALQTLMSTPGLSAVETFAQGRSTLARQGVETQEVRVLGLPAPSRLDPRVLTAGRALESDDALEIVLNESLARDTRPIRVGEHVQLTSPRGNVVDLVVVGLVHDASAATVHVPIRTAQRLLGLGAKMTGMYVVYGPMTERAVPAPVLPEAGARPEGAEVLDLGDEPVVVPTEPTPSSPEVALLREEMVLGLQSRATAAATMSRFVLEERATVTPFLLIGLLFALAAVLSVLAVLLMEREAEYATLRTLGHGRVEIARLVFTEVGALAALGTVGAVVGWLMLDVYILRSLSQALFPLPLGWRVSDLLTVAVPTLASLALAAAFAIRAILRLDLRAVLAARSIG